METKRNYIRFWNWFENNKSLFENSEISDESIKLIDQQINLLGNFAWEIGPGIHKQFSLTISPGGDKTLLIITKEIISYAPILQNWEFFSSKPIKEWENYFEVFLNGEKIGIDVSSWEYILFRNVNDTYDIQLKTNNIPMVLRNEINELYGIAEMVLDSLIGEQRRLEKIEHIEIVSEFDEDLKKGATTLVNLPNHLKNR